MANPTELQIAQAKADLGFTSHIPLHIGGWTINRVGKEYLCKTHLLKMTLSKEDAIEFVATKIADGERKWFG